MTGPRAIVVDAPGAPILLMSYRPEEDVVQIPLTAHQALRLAEELLSAGRARMNRDV